MLLHNDRRFNYKQENFQRCGLESWRVGGSRVGGWRFEVEGWRVGGWRLERRKRHVGGLRVYYRLKGGRDLEKGLGFWEG